MKNIISNATEFGFQAVDFRGYLDEMDIYKLPEFSTDIEKTKKMFKDASLEISCFSSSVKLYTFSEEDLEKHLEELKQYTKLCREFDTPYIRVFGGKIGEVSHEEALDKAVHNLQEMLKVIEGHDVQLLLETHDDWTNSDYIADIFKRVTTDKVSVLWDVHHPYRTINEKPEKTLETLGDKIKYTHWKDSYVTDKNDRGYQYCLLGEGDLPLQKIYKLLQERNFDGYYTLEWEKRWWPNIEEPEVAFKQYVHEMEQISQKHI